MLFEDSQIWMMIGVIVGAVSLIVVICVIANAYITSRRLANVLSDVEEVIHADFKGLEERIASAMTKAPDDSHRPGPFGIGAFIARRPSSARSAPSR